MTARRTPCALDKRPIAPRRALPPLDTNGCTLDNPLTVADRPTRKPSKGSAMQPGPRSARWRTSGPLAGPVCPLTRAGPTPTVPPAWAGWLGTSNSLGEAHAHWQAQPSFHCGMSTSLSCRDGPAAQAGQSEQLGDAHALSPAQPAPSFWPLEWNPRARRQRSQGHSSSFGEAHAHRHAQAAL